jgi:hypothetical protein
MKDPEEESPPQQALQTMPSGMLFGGFVGLLMGSLVAAACCWISGLMDFVRGWVLAGALVGSMSGFFIGIHERKRHGDLPKTNLATIICMVFGLLPALLIALGGIGLVRGKFSGLLCLGAVSAGPMAGLLIGGLLDRIYEGFLQRRWKRTLERQAPPERPSEEGTQCPHCRKWDRGLARGYCIHCKQEVESLN